MKRWCHTKLLVEFKGALHGKHLEECQSEWFSQNIHICKLHIYHFSDDMIEKELEIKLDITKKSRRINRPVQFADQHGEVF